MQLDLFDREKTEAAIYAFPKEVRVSHAHQIAQQLVALDFVAGKMLWQSVTQELRKALRRDGLKTEEIRQHVAVLACDVHDLVQFLSQKPCSRCVVLTLDGKRFELEAHRGGEAGAVMGRGAKLLAGVGSAHEGSEQEFALAREDAR